MRPRCSAKEGFIYPAAYCIIQQLRWLSLLTYVKLIMNRLWQCRHRTWEPNRIVVDAYVLFWLILGLGFVIFCYFRFTSDGAFIQPTVARYAILAAMVYRLTDILLAWARILLIPPLNSRAPRIIMLVLLNYAEIVISFGLMGFLWHQWPYYRPDGEIQIVDAIRASFGILTPLGVSSLPETWSTGRLFYVEYAVGLFFLVIIINVALSHLTSKLAK